MKVSPLHLNHSRVRLVMLGLVLLPNQQLLAQDEVVVIGVTPTEGLGVPLNQIPGLVRQATSENLKAAQSTDIADFLSRNSGSVAINSAQNNPLQPDVRFRGFTASPLLGLPQGIAVYQDGARLNEPLGDTVNWDLFPRSAIAGITLHGGTSPMFGLNALGGALVIDMKNGFNAEGHALQVEGGSWGRWLASVESGGNNGEFGYYANIQHFSEDGWRDLSNSRATNFYGALSWQSERTDIDLGLGLADSKLRGNGPAPVGLAEIDSSAVFTAPDITENAMGMVNLELQHEMTANLHLSGSAFWRRNTTDSFNGDASEYRACELATGVALLAGLEDDELDALGLDDDDICDGSLADADALQLYLNNLAGAAEFDLDDLTDELRGGPLGDTDAIVNVSRRRQISRGVDVQLNWLHELFGREQHLLVGGSWLRGTSTFHSTVELATLDPITRSVVGRGLGVFIEQAETELSSASSTTSLYFIEHLALTEKLALGMGGRWNRTTVRLRDLSGERPELDGDHKFIRFNPVVGLTFNASERFGIYASYSESTRAPTPIELSCNEDTFEKARALAIADGEDPDNIEFECRLPNAFLADPPLAQVVAHSLEAGVRGGLADDIRYHLGWFHTDNHNDIIFQSTGRNTGLFANVDKTRRAGIEFELTGNHERFDWYMNYSLTAATFRDDFAVLSPNHPDANEDGEVAVSRGASIPGVPRHTAKWGGDYALTDRLSVGGGIVYNSAQYLRGDEANTLDKLGGYTLVNVRARWLVSDRVELFGRVDNIFGTSFENFGLLGEDPTEVIPGLGNDSPVFVGVGAPRGAWLGIRIAL